MHRALWTGLALFVGCGGATASTDTAVAEREDEASSGVRAVERARDGEPGVLGTVGNASTLTEIEEEAPDGATGDPNAQEEAGESEPIVNPDSISSTPSHATYTHCAAPPPPDCPECGLRIALSRRRGWRADEYGFEILTEGNHIRCSVTLPCSSPTPVSCSSSPGAPQMVVETEGCDGPPEGQRLVALRVLGDACPTELRLESFRDGIRTGVDDFRPRYETGSACGRTCATAAVRHALTR